MPFLLDPYNVAGAALAAFGACLLAYLLPPVVADLRLLLDLLRPPRGTVDPSTRRTWRDNDGYQPDDSVRRQVEPRP